MPDSEKFPLWMRLADYVSLVPVVVVSLQWEKDKTFDWTDHSKALFDFLPYDAPPWMSTNYSANDIVHPNEFRDLIEPDAEEVPPDDIFAQCKIQTRMVASYVFDMDAEGWVAPCNDKATNPLFVNLGTLKARIAATGGIHQYIVDTLDPVYVVYSSACDKKSSLLPIGKNIHTTNLVEVRYRSANRKPITAHEIWHVLTDDKHSSDSNNLMRAKPAKKATKLTQAQCVTAHASAQSFNARYNDFNLHTDRVRRPPVMLTPGTFFPVAPNDKQGFKLSRSCCRIKSTGELQYIPQLDCTHKGKGTILKKDETGCSVCCLGDVDVKKEIFTECLAENVVADSACDIICCASTGAGFTMTRYRCEVLNGSYEVGCDKPKPY